MSSRSIGLAGIAVVVLAGSGCTGGAAGAAGTTTGTAAVPTSAPGLERLLLTRVTSGLPRVPDAELQPAAGRKSIDDVAGYAPDPQRQRQVLADYGYRWGWERFWRSSDALTSVFLDQFSRAGGAGSYADDLAHNDEAYYGGQLDSMPSGLPAGCLLLTVDDPAPATGMAGPAAMAWCSHGDFTVSVAAVAGSTAAARSELASVTTRQLDRLPAA